MRCPVDGSVIEHMLTDHERRITRIEEDDIPRIDQLQLDHAVLTQMVADHDKEWRKDIKELKDEFQRANERTPIKIHVIAEVVLAIVAILGLLWPHLK